MSAAFLFLVSRAPIAELLKDKQDKRILENETVSMFCYRGSTHRAPSFHSFHRCPPIQADVHSDCLAKPQRKVPCKFPAKAGCFDNNLPFQLCFGFGHKQLAYPCASPTSSSSEETALFFELVLKHKKTKLDEDVRKCLQKSADR